MFSNNQGNEMDTETKTAQHTPGPWEVMYSDTGIGVDPVCDAINARFKHDNELMRIEADANAHLIAAAPELLEACKTLIELIDTGYLVRDISHDGEPGFAIRQLEPVMQLRSVVLAIAKAEGERHADNST